VTARQIAVPSVPSVASVTSVSSVWFYGTDVTYVT